MKATNKKNILVYKNVTLKVTNGKNKWNVPYWEGFFTNISDIPPFRENTLEDLKKSFESYIDKLEKQYNLYCKLTGRE